MSRPQVSADFQNADSQGRLRLNCIGTIRDLSRQKIALREELELTLYDEELQVDGEVHFSPEEHLWVAIIDWDQVRSRPEAHMGDANDARQPGSSPSTSSAPL